MIIQFLSENKTANSNCLAEHGLSIYIETLDQKILFDTGAGNVLFYNAAAMDIDLETIDSVVISHGHYDHTQGVPRFCQANDKAKIYMHEKAFARTYAMEKGKLESQTCGVRWTPTEFDEIRNRLFLTKGVTKLSEDIVVSGTIPDIAGYVPTEKFFTKGENESLITDAMEHEQFLAIRKRGSDGHSQGIFIFSGCSHKGIVPVIAYAKILFPEETILGLIAGMHLYNATDEVKNKVMDELICEGIEMIMPVHCTGMDAICGLKNRLGEKCIIAGAGDRFII